jgi:hypothetical protein
MLGFYYQLINIYQDITNIVPSDRNNKFNFTT